MSPYLSPSPSFVDSLARRRIGVVTVGLALAVVALALEGFWRASYGFSSPAAGLLYVVLAMGVGRAAHDTLGRSSAPSVAERTVVGGVVLSTLFIVVGFLHLPVAFLPLAGALAAFGWYRSFATGETRRTVSLAQVGIALLVFGCLMRQASLVDRLALTRLEPKNFPWIDTPLWLDNAYSVEDGFPVHDTLVKGGFLDYHYGSSIVNVLVRRVTGLPMHVAYIDTVLVYSLARCYLFVDVARRLLGRVPRHGFLARLLPFVGVAWSASLSYNFPTVVSVPLLMVAVILVTRIRSWTALPLVACTYLLVAVTKEVAYLDGLVFGGFVGLYLLVTRRKVMTLIVLGLSAGVSKVIYERLIHVGMTVKIVPNPGHFSLEFIEQQEMHLGALVVAIALVPLAYKDWARDRRRATFLAALATVYFIGVLLGFTQPKIDPPYDPFFAGWVAFDMMQFLGNARDFLLVGAVVVALWSFSRFRLPEIQRRASGYVLAAVFVLTGLMTAFASNGNAEEDPMVKLLGPIDPHGTLLALNVFPFPPVPEFPHPGAVYGHHFFLLRKGRWATAAPRFADLVREQDVLFHTADRAEALAIVRSEGITHLAMERQAPVPWLMADPPPVVSSNDFYQVYDLRPLLH